MIEQRAVVCAALAAAGCASLSSGCVRDAVRADAAVSALGTTAQPLLVDPLLPTAIFHAFDQQYTFLESYVCTLGDQGYSHVQIAPAQKSNDTGDWKGRYQPIDFSEISGRGTLAELSSLINKAHNCPNAVKVIADVVFNHMTDAPPFYQSGDNSFHFKDLSASDFHAKRDILYSNQTRDDELNGWLDNHLPDLDQDRVAVQKVTKDHLSLLLGIGIDGFRFDAAKHMSGGAVQMYINHVNGVSGNGAWSYLEVIEDDDTNGTDYNGIAAVTDFRLYKNMQAAFSFGGDLRSLKVPVALDDARSVVFGINHDTDSDIHDHPIYAYANRGDSVFATAYVLARQAGVPLILASDNLNVPFVHFGVKFRQIMRQRGEAGQFVKDNVLDVLNSDVLLVMERGSEGFFVVNKGTSPLDVPALDMTLTHLEGCYRELRGNLLVAIERRNDGKKYVTRWATWNRGGMEVHARDALYFIREPWGDCAN
jgi:alpha-amylase